MTMAEIALALVIACHGELGYPETADECHLESHINAAKVGYRPEATARQVKRYNTVWKRKGRRWLMDTHHARAARSVTLDCARPSGLRAKLSWNRRMVGKSYSRRDSCLAIVAAVWAFLEAPGRHPCPKASHYGGAMDQPPACAVRVDCGETSQRYYHYRRCRPGLTVPASVAAGRKKRQAHP